MAQTPDGEFYAHVSQDLFSEAIKKQVSDSAGCFVNPLGCRQW